jgi:hypothetical protein
MANPYKDTPTADLKILRATEVQTRNLARKIKNEADRTRLVRAASERIGKIDAELRRRRTGGFSARG